MNWETIGIIGMNAMCVFMAGFFYWLSTWKNNKHRGEDIGFSIFFLSFAIVGIVMKFT